MKDIGTIMQKYSKINIQDFAARFKHPALKGSINTFMPEGDYSAVSVLFPLGTFTGNHSSIPYGGSKAMAMRMVERYISLGGKVEASCEVEGLDIQRKMIKKVICMNGRAFEADYVIAACDANVLYERLLKNQYNDPKFQKRYNNPEYYPLASNINIGV